jgi:pyruvate,water dikinase
VTVAWFDELGRNDVARAGGKGANLGELTRAGLPVPPGFVVVADGYLRAMEQAGARDELCGLVERVAADDPLALHAASERARDIVERVTVPEELRAELLRAYHELGEDKRVRCVHRPRRRTQRRRPSRG